MNTDEYIEKWISGKESFSFFLPSGSDGRPFDNQYSIQMVKRIENGLIIELSNSTEIVFIGEVRYQDDVCNLILSGFERLDVFIKNTLVYSFSKGEFCLTGF